LLAYPGWHEPILIQKKSVPPLGASKHLGRGISNRPEPSARLADIADSSVFNPLCSWTWSRPYWLQETKFTSFMQPQHG